MSDELPEWPTAGESTENAGKGITQRVDEFLQVACNEHDLGLGPQVVTKWIVIAEVGMANGGRSLREIDSDLMPWEVRGMLKHVDDWHRGDSYSVEDDNEGEDA